MRKGASFRLKSLSWLQPAKLLLSLGVYCVLAGQINATQGTVDVRSGAEIVRALQDPSVHTVYLMYNMVLSESDWNGAPLPYILTRNFTLAKHPSLPDMPILDLSFTAGHIQLMQAVVFTFMDLVLTRYRGDTTVAQAPGFDVLTTAQPGLVPQPAMSIVSGGLVLRACMPVALASMAASTMPRPPQYGGNHSIDWRLPQPNCVNDSVQAPAPALTRCWPGRGMYWDLKTYGANIDASGKAVPSNYLVLLTNVTLLCEQLMTEQCAQQLGPLGCWLFMFGRASTPSPPPAASRPVGSSLDGSANDSKQPSASPADSTASGGSDGGNSTSGATVAAIVGGVVGGVVVLAIIVVAVMVRNTRRKPETAEVVAGTGGGGGGSEQKAYAGKPSTGRSSRSIDGKPFGGSQSSVSAAAAVAVGKLLGGSSGAGKGVGGSGAPDSAIEAVLTSACGEDPSTAASSAGEVVLHIDGAGGGGGGGAAPTAANGNGDGRGVAVGVGAVVAASLVDTPDGGGSEAAAAAAAAVARAGAPMVSASTSAGTPAAAAAPPSSISAGAPARAPAAAAVAPSSVAAGESSAAASASAAAQSSSDLLWGMRPKSDAIDEGAAPLVVVTPFTPPRADYQEMDDTQAAQELRLVPVTLGKGTYGRVMAGEYRGRRVAVKLLTDPEGMPADQLEPFLETFAREAEVLGRCEHVNVVKLLAANLRPPRVCLVMELMETSLDRMMYGGSGGHKPQQQQQQQQQGQQQQGPAGQQAPAPQPAGGPPGVKLLPLTTMLQISIQVARGLEYLHPTIVHRDLKPGNVLINGADTPERLVAKLTDFGLSRLRNTVLVTKDPEAGTPAYTAPECFDPTNYEISHQADMYSLGVLMWEMIVGERPFDGLQMVAIAYRVTVQGKRPPWPAGLDRSRCPKRLKALIEECWDPVPRRRPAAAEVVKRLMMILQSVQSKLDTSSLENSDDEQHPSGDGAAGGAGPTRGSKRQLLPIDAGGKPLPPRVMHGVDLARISAELAQSEQVVGAGVSLQGS